MLERTILKENARYRNAFFAGDIAKMVRCAERLDTLTHAKRTLASARRALDEILGGGR